VSIVGSNLPDGIQLGSVSYGKNGVDSILLSGTPKNLGDYPLNLVITDNDGALLTTPFDFNIVNGNLIFTDNSLPNATLLKPYYLNLSFTHNGNGATFHVSPSSSEISIQNQNYVTTGVKSFISPVIIELIPYEAGEYKINVFATTDNSAMVGSKTFILTVDNPNISPKNLPIPFNQATVAPATVQQPANRVSNPPPPPPVEKAIKKKPAQPATTIKDTQNQEPTIQSQIQTQHKPQTKPNIPNNIFLKIWNFIENIFK
jgi:hypothetical protein